MKKSTDAPKQLQKCPTGVKGFDEITEGGLPENRITLVSGGAGSIAARLWYPEPSGLPYRWPSPAKNPSS